MAGTSVGNVNVTSNIMSFYAVLTVKVFITPIITCAKVIDSGPLTAPPLDSCLFMRLWTFQVSQLRRFSDSQRQALLDARQQVTTSTVLYLLGTTSSLPLYRNANDRMSGSSSLSAAEKAATNTSPRISYRDLMLNHGYFDSNILSHAYDGSGTDEDPFLIGWIDHDPRNPLRFRDRRKWLWTLLVALATMAVALTTSDYTAPAKEIKEALHVSQEVFELGLSVFVLGFAVGPLFWGPLSELYGRQIIFAGTVSAPVLPA